MNDRRYPELFQFFGGYFHEDWPVDAATADNVVETFMERNREMSAYNSRNSLIPSPQRPPMIRLLSMRSSMTSAATTFRRRRGDRCATGCSTLAAGSGRGCEPSPPRPARSPCARRGAAIRRRRERHLDERSHRRDRLGESETLVDGIREAVLASRSQVLCTKPDH